MARCGGWRGSLLWQGPIRLWKRPHVGATLQHVKSCRLFSRPLVPSLRRLPCSALGVDPDRAGPGSSPVPLQGM